MQHIFLVISLSAIVWTVCATRVHLELGQHVEPPVGSGWRVVRRCFPGDSIVLTFALKLRNVDELERLFRQISTPGSLSYQEHMSLDEVQLLTRPDAHVKRAVEAWLLQEGASQRCKATASGDFLECAVSCRIAEQLLHTEFFQYLNNHNETVMRANKLYSVPSDISSLLDFVGGTHRFPPTRRQRTPVSSPEALGITPSVLRRHYNVSDTVGKMNSNKQAVAQFLKQHFSELDLKEFFLLFGDSFTHRDRVDKIVGPNDGLLEGTEASLDVEYIMSLGANISTWFWSTAGLHEGQEPFLQWIIGVGNTSDAPSVFSVSYGDDEDSLSPSYMERINQEFMKLGARGISVLCASGDSGAGCNGKNVFVPSFPASSPYVTTVGGTEFEGVIGNGEVGNYISGGGFSNVFSQPDYQQTAVQKFFSSANHLPDSKLFNKSGRGYPDISALSNGFMVVVDLLPLPVSGTSCAAPTVSGIIALVNDHLLQAGKPVLGFLNPFLYQHSSALTDITDGCNAGCSGTGFCSQSGWDPVTGNGVPNYPTLVQATLKSSQ